MWLGPECYSARLEETTKLTSTFSGRVDFPKVESKDIEPDESFTSSKVAGFQGE